ACAVEALSLKGDCGAAISAGNPLLDSKRPEVYQALLRCHLAAGASGMGEARRVADRYRSQRPDDVRAWLASAEIDLFASQPQAALKDLQEASHRARSNADRIDVSRALARAYLAMHRPTDAERELESIASLAPQDADARHQLGLLVAERDPARG